MGFTLSIANAPSWAQYWFARYSPNGTWQMADFVQSPILPMNQPWEVFAVLPASANGFDMIVLSTNDFSGPTLQLGERYPRGSIVASTIYLYDWVTGKFTPPLGGGGGIPKEWLIGGGILLGGLLLMGVLKKK